MSLIKVEHLTFSYPESLTPVFKDASFKLDTNWRLGLKPHKLRLFSADACRSDAAGAGRARRALSPR